MYGAVPGLKEIPGNTHRDVNRKHHLLYAWEERFDAWETGIPIPDLPPSGWQTVSQLLVSFPVEYIQQGVHVRKDPDGSWAAASSTLDEKRYLT